MTTPVVTVKILGITGAGKSLLLRFIKKQLELLDIAVELDNPYNEHRLNVVLSGPAKKRLFLSEL